MESMSMAEIVGMLGAPLLSMVVGFLTRSSTPAKVKTYLLLALALAYSVVEEFVTSPDGFNLVHTLIKFVASFVIAVNTHNGFSKQTGLANYLQDRVGIGLGAKPDGERRE